MTEPAHLTPDLDALLRLFYAQPEEAGRFEEVTLLAMPAIYRGLLAHELHMTVTVEAHHHCLVDVEVLRKRVAPPHYARMILLRRQSDRKAVMYGIVRVNLSLLDDAVRREIQSERTPLGRILIEHGVLTHVQLFSVWKVAPGPDLARHLELAEPLATYGRTAIILCDGEPAIELLEIVAPEPS